MYRYTRASLDLPPLPQAPQGAFKMKSNNIHSPGPNKFPRQPESLTRTVLCYSWSASTQTGGADKGVSDGFPVRSLAPRPQRVDMGTLRSQPPRKARNDKGLRVGEWIAKPLRIEDSDSLDPLGSLFYTRECGEFCPISEHRGKYLTLSLGNRRLSYED
jgi:hypothetical protein